SRDVAARQRLKKTVRAGRQHQAAWVRQAQFAIERLLDLNQIEKFLPRNRAASQVAQHVGVRTTVHVNGELIVRHLVSAQVLRNNLPRFDLQIGVPVQHAVEVKDDALVPHAEQAHRDLISQTSTDCRGDRREVDEKVQSVNAQVSEAKQSRSEERRVGKESRY